MTPSRTADASRGSIREYLRAITKTINALEPTLEEIREIEDHCLIIANSAKRWRSSEALCMAANRAAVANQLHRLGIAG